MGGRYCAINSPWGFACVCVCGSSGELIAQYQPPMSFGFYPTYYLHNHLYFLSLAVLEKSKRVEFISHPLNWIWRHGEATTLTCDVTMVPVDARAPNITNSLHPNHLCILLNCYTFITGKTIWDWIKCYFFQFSYICKISKFTLSICISSFEVLPLCFRKSHYLKKILDFAIHLLIPA